MYAHILRELNVSLVGMQTKACLQLKNVCIFTICLMTGTNGQKKNKI